MANLQFYMRRYGILIILFLAIPSLAEHAGVPDDTPEPANPTIEEFEETVNKINDPEQKNFMKTLLELKKDNDRAQQGKTPEMLFNEWKERFDRISSEGTQSEEQRAQDAKAFVSRMVATLNAKERQKMKDYIDKDLRRDLDDKTANFYVKLALAIHAKEKQLAEKAKIEKKLQEFADMPKQMQRERLASEKAAQEEKKRMNDNYYSSTYKPPSADATKAQSSSSAGYENLKPSTPDPKEFNKPTVWQMMQANFKDMRLTPLEAAASILSKPVDLVLKDAGGTWEPAPPRKTYSPQEIVSPVKDRFDQVKKGAERVWNGIWNRISPPESD